MLMEWIRLLAGAVAFGATIVLTMVSHRRFHLPGIVFGIVSFAIAVSAFGAIASRYERPEAIVPALFFLLAGVIGGYWLAAAALPVFARTERPGSLERLPVESRGDDRIAVIVLADGEPEHYDMRALASAQHLLTETEALTIPVMTTPFIFLSEKARYRAIGGTLPTHAAARSVVDKMGAMLAGEPSMGDIRLAWCTGRPSLAESVHRAHADGYDHLVVVPLGSDESFVVRRARDTLEVLQPRAAGMSITFAPPLWHSTRLARRLADRVVAVTQDVSLEEVGVVLVGEGQPPAWIASHQAWSEQENYFAQRVRLHLSERGINEELVRIGWLEWQLPDVTEAVRHLAALGCRRIVVAPGMIALPSLATAIDLEYAVRIARLSAAISVVTLAPWADDDIVAEVLVEGVRSALHGSW